jgi:hypothetical protein
VTLSERRHSGSTETRYAQKAIGPVLSEIKVRALRPCLELKSVQRVYARRSNGLVRFVNWRVGLQSSQDDAALLEHLHGTEMYACPSLRVPR